MTADATIRSDAWLPASSRRRSGQALWAVAAVGIALLVIAASTYGAFMAYNWLAYGVVPGRTDFAWAAVAIGVVYGGLCLADNQYDLLGDEWNRQSCARGLGA